MRWYQITIVILILFGLNRCLCLPKTELNSKIDTNPPFLNGRLASFLVLRLSWSVKIAHRVWHNLGMATKRSLVTFPKFSECEVMAHVLPLFWFELWSIFLGFIIFRRSYQFFVQSLVFEKIWHALRYENCQIIFLPHWGVLLRNDPSGSLSKVSFNLSCKV